LQEMPLFPEARAVLDKYSGLIEPYFITSREERIMPPTLDWLASTGLDYNPEHVYSSIKKDELAVKLGLDLFVEDKGENAVLIAQKRIPVLLIQYPWNLGFEKDQDYIYPVQGWPEIDSFLRDLCSLPQV